MEFILGLVPIRSSKTLVCNAILASVKVPWRLISGFKFNQNSVIYEHYGLTHTDTDKHTRMHTCNLPPPPCQTKGNICSRKLTQREWKEKVKLSLNVKAKAWEEIKHIIIIAEQCSDFSWCDGLDLGSESSYGRFNCSRFWWSTQFSMWKKNVSAVCSSFL